MRAATGRTAYAVLALAVMLPLLAVGQSAQAQEASATSGVRQAGIAITDQAWAAGRQRFGVQVTAGQAIEAYWTPERMRNAVPVEESPVFQAAVQRYNQSGGTASAPLPGRRSKPVDVPPAEGSMGTPPLGVAPAATNPNFSTTHPTARTSGKVFLTMNGVDGSCSATVVNSTNLDTVWTAGHCVHGGANGSLASNWQFVPAYDDDLSNPEPYGRWTARELWTWSTWIDRSDWTADIAVAIMNTRNGVHIVSQFGGHGFRTNQGTTVSVNAFGYPRNASTFDGGNLLRCSGTSTQHATQIIRIPCDFNRGASGGAWLINWDGNWGYLNGVNSTVNSYSNPTQLRSPYFDATAAELYAFTATR